MKHLNHISLSQLELQMKKKHYTEGEKTLREQETNDSNKSDLLRNQMCYLENKKIYKLREKYELKLYKGSL